MISDSDFERLVAYVKSQAGIDLSKKRVLVTTRLENHILNAGYKGFGEYINNAISGGKEAEELINILTTNHTFFWREEKHFEYMLSHVFPELKVRCKDTKDIRIWCAASSTGEEPYTLAMAAMEFFGVEHKLWDTTILATDISTEVLRKATIGIYNKESISNLPAKWQQRFFVERGEVVEVTEELKKQVLFRRLNLMDMYPFRKKLQVIFVRNVLIYFDEETKRQIIEKMINCLETGGYLFIGTTESLGRITDRLEFVIPSVYRKIK